MIEDKKYNKLLDFVTALESQTENWDTLCDCPVGEGEVGNGEHKEECMTMKIRKDFNNAIYHWEE